MPTLQRQDLPQLLTRIAGGDIAPVYLLVGERYLCREAAEKIVATLLPAEKDRSARLTTIDGEREDPARTLAELRTYNLFGGHQVTKVVDSRLLCGPTATTAATTPETAAKAAAPPAGKKDKGRSKDDITTQYLTALEAGLPPGTTLLLLAETADRRKKLYKYLAQNAVIIDLGVAPGNTAPARKEQKKLLAELTRQTLAAFNKRLAADALDPLLDRIGFHPVAVVMEAEKLALYVGERPLISREDVDTMVGRTREEAIFELSEAYSGGRLEPALALLERLRRGGMPSPAILGGLRNHVRKLLLARAVLDGGSAKFNSATPFPAFQKEYLPRLRQEREAGRGWPALFPGHPYALYQLFLQSARLDLARLRTMLADILRAEARLKGSTLPDGVVLSALLLGAGGSGSDLLFTRK